MRLLLSLLFLLLGSEVAWGQTIERVTAAESESATSLRIEVSAPIRAFSQPVRQGRGVEITLFNTQPVRGLTLPQATGLLRAAPSVRTQSEHTVVAFEVEPHVNVTVGGEPGSNAFVIRLDPGRARTSGTIAVTPQGIAAPERLATPPGVAVVGTPSRPNPRPNEGSAPSSRWQFDTVVIDAGHGGRDPGAVGHGYREKDIVLAVALKLGQMVERLGVRVVYTRTDDRFIELRDRGRIANAANGKLFVSIHANAAAENSATAVGTETFFLGSTRTAQARAVMERENSVVRLEEDPGAYEQFNEEALILRTMAMSTYLRKAERIAGLIENEFVSHARRTSRGVKQAPFYVLWGASMPAVLVELGFISNRSEAQFMASERGQVQLAESIYRAIAAFKAEYEQDLQSSSR